MPQKISIYASIMLVAAVLGLMLALQFRTVNRASNGISIDRARELTAELKQIKEEEENLSKEISDLTFKIDQIDQGQAEAVSALESELNKTRMSAGLVRVSGPGVELVLDKPDMDDDQAPPELMMIIGDEDLLNAVNELWGAGAEAISINGERIVATTEIRLAGSFININLNRVFPPYQILAIGNPQELMGTLEMPEGLKEHWRDIGIKVSLEKYDDLTLPAYGKR